MKKSNNEDQSDWFKDVLDCQGHSRSRSHGTAIAADGSPIPWYTYPAIEYLETIDLRGVKIFEYGSGNSTLYFSRRGADVFAVEHDPEWFDQMIFKSSNFNSIVLRTNKEAYARYIIETGELFDIIVIDGKWRRDCQEVAINRLSSNGMIIVDNSDWYTDVTSNLALLGFLPFHFSGFGPVNNYCWTTTFFVQSQFFWGRRVGCSVPVGGTFAHRTDSW